MFLSLISAFWGWLALAAALDRSWQVGTCGCQWCGEFRTVPGMRPWEAGLCLYTQATVIQLLSLVSFKTSSTAPINTGSTLVTDGLDCQLWGIITFHLAMDGFIGGVFTNTHQSFAWQKILNTQQGHETKRCVLLPVRTSASALEADVYCAYPPVWMCWDPNCVFGMDLDL